MIAHLSGQQTGGAGTATPVAATIGQPNILAKRGIENGFVLLDVELVPTAVDRNRKTHGFLQLGMRNFAILVDFKGD